MGIIFPINPLHGQQYTPSGIPITWQYDSGRNAWRVLRPAGSDWDDISNKPLTFPPSTHTHAIADVTDLQATLDVKQDISARGQPNGYASLNESGRVPETQLPFFDPIQWDDIEGKPSTFPPQPHAHLVSEISDSGTTGQAVMRAVLPLDARNAIGAISQDENARVQVKNNGTLVGLRRAVNFIPGTNITLTTADDSANEEIEVQINAAGGPAGAARLFVQQTAPASPLDNDLWFDNTSGLLLMRYNDGDSVQWIEQQPFVQTIPAASAKITFPTAPTDGQDFEPITGLRWRYSTQQTHWRALGSSIDAYTKAEADARFVNLAGSTMTGPLTLPGNPGSALHAATKQYVDNADATLNTAVLNRVLKAGDTMTGLLILSGNPAVALGAATKQYVDTKEPAITAGTTAQYWRGDKSWQTLDKAAVGLANVDNTSDANKPVSTAQAAADALRVLKAGDTMTGVLDITMPWATISLNKAASGEDASLIGTRGGTRRWLMALGNSVAETGSNAGSNFILYRYADGGGAPLGTAMEISRANGNITIGASLLTGNTSPAQYNGKVIARGVAGVAALEWGHSNVAGYGATLGFNGNGGAPWIGLCCGPGTNPDTFKTLGLKGSVILGDTNGGVYIGTVATANADNQTPSYWGQFIGPNLSANAPNTGSLRISGGIFAQYQSYFWACATVSDAAGLGGATLGGQGGCLCIDYGGSGSNQGMILRARNTSASVIALFFLNSSNNGVGNIQVTNTNTAYNTSSDERLKRNLQPYTAAKETVDALKVYVHDWVEPEAETSVGLVAQEVQEVYPQAVSPGSDGSMGPGDEGFVPWGMDYGKFTPLLIAAVQDIHRRLEALEGAA